MRARFIVVASLCSLLPPACGGGVMIEPPVTHPVVEPASIPVIIQYANDLRGHKCTGHRGYIDYSWTFELGPPSIAMFNDVFASLFSKIEVVAPGGIGTPGRDTIELQLSEFNGCEASWPIVGTTTIDIAYQAIAVSAGGKEIARWTGQGRASSGDDLSGYRGSVGDMERWHLAALTSLAMRKAAADFVVNFENDPKVRAWLGE